MGSPLLDYAKQRHLPIPLETRTARFGFALCELKYFSPSSTNRLPLLS